MAAALASSAGLRPQHLSTDIPYTNLERDVPKEFGGWRVDEATIPIQAAPDVQAALDKIYNQVLGRTYVDRAGRRIMLSIAYGGNQTDGLQVHLPEGCYGGQGFAVSPKIKALLDTSPARIPVARLVATKGPRAEPITYWLVVAGQVSTNSWDAKMAKLLYTLKGQVPDGFLIRISSVSTDTEAAYRLQQEFASALIAALPADLAARFVGTGS
jgi:EpsI family protein